MFFFRSRAAAPKRKPALIPDGRRVYAIGDIHGRYDLLTRMLDTIHRDAAGGAAEPQIVFLGDYIDRGADSRSVLECLRGGTQHGWTCLMGNHEAMLLAVLDGELDWPMWLGHGGAETLFSYGLSTREFAGRTEPEALREAVLSAVPASHIDFLRGLAGSHEVGGYFFCHAGIRPGVALERQVLSDLLWIREDFTESALDHGKRVVHGHTPVMEPEILPNRVNVDTGAYLTNRLSCVVLEADQLRILQV
nr:metallophosphoesterase family protein [Ancylobacter gelatini]